MIAIVFCLGFIAASPPGNPAANLLILYTGNTLGELKPCGCAKEEDQGGIERRAAYLKEVRAGHQNILLVDTGDSFKKPTTQGKLKARYLMKSMGQMDYDAVVPGDKDLVYGNRFFDEIPGIPWVAANLELLPGLPIPAYRIKHLANGLKAAIVGLVDPGLFYVGDSADIRITPPRESLRQTLRQLRQREKPDLVLLLTHMQRETALSLLKVEGVDVIVNGHIDKATDLIDMAPVQNNGRIFVQAAPRGQKVGELQVQVGPQTTRVFQHHLVKLDSHVKFDPEMLKLYEEYNEKIEEIFFASVAAKKGKNKKTIYATETTCKPCHAKAHDIWSRSGHGRAYETLKKVNKAFDPECLACHTVGFNRPGGFLSETDSPDLANVQCEVCHGPARAHTLAPRKGWSKNARKACGQCHVKNHSPRFDFATYWPRIKH
ncbi:MAG: multiheme c-type cytochrome [Nitrospinota bacterium]|nr:multiheme c-type cytochrome [Nitrospinota bacterium]